MAAKDKNSRPENVHEGHRKRMRQRFLQTGTDGFSDHQILEMLLFYACPRRDTNELAHRLIDRFGSFSAVLDAEVSQLCTVEGMTENAATLFRLVPAAASKYFGGRTQGVVYDNSDKLKDLFRSSLMGTSREEFHIACFNNDLTLCCIKKLTTGTPGAIDINMRLLTEAIFESKASMTAFGHNHPHGVPAPSEEDIQFTRRVNQVLKELGIYLMDHIIVGGSSCFSMRENAAISIFD